MDDEDSDKQTHIAFIIVLCISAILYSGLLGSLKTFNIEYTESVLLQDNTFLQMSLPSTVDAITFGNKGSNQTISLYGIKIPVLLYEIFKCENRQFDPDQCNSEYGCNSGMGIGQLIPSTVKYVESKLDRNIDPYNPHDNIIASLWLFENEGTSHWGTAQTEWGSYSCWSKYL